MPKYDLDLEGVPKVLWPGLRFQMHRILMNNPKVYEHESFEEFFGKIANNFMQVKDWDNKQIYNWMAAAFNEARRQKFLKDE
jgi:hypothetical protein